MFRARTRCPELKSIVYNFDSEALERWFEEPIQWNIQQLERSLALSDPEIRRLMTRIGLELRNPGFASNALIKLMAGEVLIALLREFRDEETNSRKGGLSPWRLRLVDDYLEPNQLRRRFRRWRSYASCQFASFQEYLNSVVVACWALISPNTGLKRPVACELRVFR